MEIFCYFFSEFAPPGRVWAEFGFKILLSLSRPISFYPVPFWLKITLDSCFLNFLNFLIISFRNFLHWVEYERNSGLKFFYLLLGLSNPVLAKNNDGKLFFNFLNFFAIFFSEFSPQGRVWAEFRCKILFSLSRPVSSPIWLKIMPKSCSLIFWNFFLFFFGICSPWSSIRGIRV